MMKTTYLFFAITVLLCLASCNNDDDATAPAPAPVVGCMDSRSLNYNPIATIDNGDCAYSQVTFYGRYNAYNTALGPAYIDHVEVFVEGNFIGYTAHYPNGPGNCSSPGTVSYQFQDRNTVDWNSTVYLTNGMQLYWSGTVTPTPAGCIKVNVTL